MSNRLLILNYLPIVYSDQDVFRYLSTLYHISRIHYREYFKWGFKLVLCNTVQRASLTSGLISCFLDSDAFGVVGN